MVFMNARLLAVLLLCGLSPLSIAAANDKQAQRLAASCASCHGTAGVAVNNSLPVLAGQSKENIISSMQAFKSGARPATVMQQLAKGYTEEQIVLIATYFAGLKTVEAGAVK